MDGQLLQAVGRGLQWMRASAIGLIVGQPIADAVDATVTNVLLKPIVRSNVFCFFVTS